MTQLFSSDEEYRRYLKGLLNNDRQQCRESFERWLGADPDLRTLYEELIRRSLYEIGEMWERGEISVATEHVATAISESLLNLTYPRLFEKARIGKTAVIAASANEFHQLGAKMVADFFELKGWRGYFLGANTPQADLVGMIKEKQPDVVALSLTFQSNLDQLVRTASAIRAESPVPILVGGQALRWGGREQLETLPAVRCLNSLSELETWLENA